MITIHFAGGLGNQMFQYAHYLQLKHDYPLAVFNFDCDSYRFEIFHTGFDLGRIFKNIDVPYCVPQENRVCRLYYKLKVTLKKKLYPHLGCFLNYITDTPVYNLDALLFRQKHIETTKNNYVKGTWYSDKLFADVHGEVRDVFVFPEILDESNKAHATHIQNSNSVSLHIRRGDFLKLEQKPLSESDYYERAVKEVSEMTGIDNLHLFVFSDEPDWCKENLHFLKGYEHTFITDNQGAQAFRDMQLMSMCKHNICANSSFSWWAAFLNVNADKIVVCPAIGNATIEKYIYMDNWIKL